MSPFASFLFLLIRVSSYLLPHEDVVVEISEYELIIIVEEFGCLLAKVYLKCKYETEGRQRFSVFLGLFVDCLNIFSTLGHSPAIEISYPSLYMQLLLKCTVVGFLLVLYRKSWSLWLLAKLALPLPSATKRTTMNGKKASGIQIDICLPPNATPQSESMKKSTKDHNGKALILMRKLMMEVWEFSKEDTDRVTFSLKVSLACLLVSLLILIQALYQVFDTNFILEKVKIALTLHWCGHYKKLAPEYEKLGSSFKKAKSVLIGKIVLDVNKDVLVEFYDPWLVYLLRYGVSGYPTLKFFPKENKAGEDYEAERELDDFVKFINVKCGISRDANGQLTFQLQDIKLYTFYMELDLQKPYPTRGSDLLAWEFTNLKYSRVEIDEVRFEWAECMLDYI
ncbi:hypothetical protein ZIOFF_021683 [Zingiber officinale]|uniref:Thioredoxin domain-containing protein n=1 Tax=Zingiber officinale TaxID=94328 RepID=A0A8J5H7E4_ZINOF|nr:hypothetical protein ZIOFF_021683 [Zingiber officinale]